MMKVISTEYGPSGIMKTYKTTRYEVRVTVLHEGVDDYIRYGCAIDYYDRPYIITSMKISPVSKLDAFRLAKQAIHTKMLMRI